MSRDLATIEQDIPIDCNGEFLEYSLDKDRLAELFLSLIHICMLLITLSLQMEGML